MEFHEKLQELRKSRGLTQEELAEALYVSRTAISKWESGRGYPSIDSLKEISKYFSVTIDDLLSGEALISIAERENKTNIQNLFDLLFGMVDMLSVLLIVLPLYPRTVDGYVYSVNLFEYLETSAMNRFVYWFLFLGLIVLGVWKVLLVQMKSGKHQKLIRECSLLVSIAAVIVLALAGETYAVTVVFLLLMIKGVVIFKSNMV
ncbi:MAG: helix-turn-helix domain-containing protein [Lachnospiraceae bacterium]|nr:helix-turn-helix domain-containing protein [Lachnospiraceae bacterium]